MAATLANALVVTAELWEQEPYVACDEEYEAAFARYLARVAESYRRYG